jgi:hypothetical protein
MKNVRFVEKKGVNIYMCLRGNFRQIYSDRHAPFSEPNCKALCYRVIPAPLSDACTLKRPGVAIFRTTNPRQRIKAAA